MKTLAVVSGGDAPGINAALYRFTRLARTHGGAVFGALGAFEGVLERRLLPLTPEALAPTVGQGGSFLPSSRSPVLGDRENRERVAAILGETGIDNVVLFGGDGTLRHLPGILTSLGVACVGIPATIDNDVPGSERTLGFASACTAAHTTIDGLLATARALPGRVFSVEVLGGTTGFLALDIAHAAGADAVLVPEYDYDLASLGPRLQRIASEQGWALTVLSEGIRDSHGFVAAMRQVGVRVRSSRLGHGQRGAIPVHTDRKLAIEMAEAAYTALAQGADHGTVVVENGAVTLLELPLSTLPQRRPDRELYRRINGLENQNRERQ